MRKKSEFPIIQGEKKVLGKGPLVASLVRALNVPAKPIMVGSIRKEDTDFYRNMFGVPVSAIEFDVEEEVIYLDVEKKEVMRESEYLVIKDTPYSYELAAAKGSLKEAGHHVREFLKMLPVREEQTPNETNVYVSGVITLNTIDTMLDWIAKYEENMRT